MNVLTDDDVREVDVATVVETMERAVEHHGRGDLHAPPRWSLEADGGTLVFTCGATPEAFGFRAYETYPEFGPDHQQLVGVWDAANGAFRGIIVGHQVGILRTAGIGGVAVSHLSRASADTVGVLGTGPHARAQTRAACAVRAVDQVQVYSPTRNHRETFAEKMPEKTGTAVRARDDPEPVVRDADVLLVATDSDEPVFEAEWVQPGTHVNTLGPKFTDAHEVPEGLFDRADALVTDSLAQTQAYDEPFVVGPSRLVELGDVVRGDLPERDESDVTVFLSVGLAGTEVALADELL